MIKVENNNIFVETDKLYVIPINDIYNWVLNNDEFLSNISMEDLVKVFIYGIPENLKDYLLKKVGLYDSSSAVNSFIYQGQEYWLDKSQRSTLFNLFSNSEAEEEFEIVFGDIQIKEKAAFLASFLQALEKYAYRCFVVTQKHLNTINAIKTPENAEQMQEYINILTNYDYTAGYPEKIEL